jgi:hypothetical protein
MLSYKVFRNTTSPTAKVFRCGSLSVREVYLACCVAIVRLRRLHAGTAEQPFVMPAGRVVPWIAAGLIVALLARAGAQAWLLTGGVIAAASIAFLLQPSGRSSHPTP